MTYIVLSSQRFPNKNLSGDDWNLYSRVVDVAGVPRAGRGGGGVTDSRACTALERAGGQSIPVRLFFNPFSASSRAAAFFREYAAVTAATVAPRNPRRAMFAVRGRRRRCAEPVWPRVVQRRCVTRPTRSHCCPVRCMRVVRTTRRRRRRRYYIIRIL